MSRELTFPSTKALLADPSVTGETSAFYGGQKATQVFADISDTVSPSFQWPPFLDQVATEKGLHMVLNAAEAGIAWAPQSLDISSEVIKKLDGAKPAATPAAGRN